MPLHVGQLTDSTHRVGTVRGSSPTSRGDGEEDVFSLLPSPGPEGTMGKLHFFTSQPRRSHLVLIRVSGEGIGLVPTIMGEV